MSKSFFPKLAVSNIKKNGKTYIPYILTCILTIAMFYIVKSLSMNPGLEKMVGADTLVYIMFLGSWVVAIFSFVFLFYTNSFLVKRRKKEFGVFNILGMEKKHLSKVLGWETVYVAVVSLVVGLLAGIALDKVMFLLITKMLGGEIVLGFFISSKAVADTLLLFCVIFLMIYFNSIHQIYTADPIELLRGGNVGEKEPKTKWFMAILGAVSLGWGYYIAVTTKNPVSSLLLFFLAVILVIVGTYLLFTAGSIAFLKMLRKNKRYYYKTKHFISVSGMIYRMKQNAVGLANICILSTGVLIMVSSTTSLVLGMEDILDTRYPNDFVLYSSEPSDERNEEIVDAVKELQKSEKLKITGEMQYHYLAFAAVRQGDSFLVGKDVSIDEVDSINNLIFLPLSEYNRVTGEDKVLDGGEIIIYSNREGFDASVLKVGDREYKIKEKLDKFPGNGIIAANVSSSQFIVVPDLGELDALYRLQAESLGDIASEVRMFYGFDSGNDEDTQKEFYERLNDLLAQQEFEGTVESKAEARKSFFGVYGGFFFIGIFLGTLFVMATVLIIYYKQISEGYDDRERFAIMQKVGMSPDEVKDSIRSQVITVFFLPLAAAGVHVVFAFPIISRILALLNLTNIKLYIICTVGCFLVFAVMYVLIYAVTARTYYKIVSR